MRNWAQIVGFVRTAGVTAGNWKDPERQKNQNQEGEHDEQS